MNDQSLENPNTATDAANAPEATSQEPVERTYTQAEFDRHMAGLKSSLAKKYEKQFADLGDIEELRALKQQAEQRKTEEQMKKGEFESILRELATKKDAEISKRDAVIREFKIDSPLINAAAKYRAVNPEQVKALLKNQVNLNADGEVEVLGTDGQVRYNDKGLPVTVDELVREWLDSNLHFVAPTPATTTSRTSINNGVEAMDISKLDLTDPKQREVYAEWRKKTYTNVRKVT